MKNKNVPVGLLVEQAEAAVLDPSLDWREAARRVDALGEAFEKAPQADREVHRLTARAVRALTSLMGSDSGHALWKPCIRGLAVLGPLARQGFARLVRDRVQPLDKLTPAMRELDFGHRLLLLNEIILLDLSGRDKDPVLLAWVKDLLLKEPDFQGAGAVRLLARLEQDARPLTHPVRVMLEERGLAGALEDFGAQALDEKELETLARAAAVLGEPDMVRRAAAEAAGFGDVHAARILRPLIGAVQPGDSKVARAVCDCLKDPAPGTALELAAHLLRLDWPKAGAVLSLLFRGDKALQPGIARLCAVMPREVFSDFSATLSARERDLVRALAFQAVCAMDPAFPATLLAREAQGRSANRPGPEAVKALQKFIAVHGRDIPLSPPEPGPRPEVKSRAPGKGLTEALAGKGSLVDASFARASATKARVSGKKFTRTDMSGARLRKGVFQGCSFSRTILAGAVLGDTVFKGCVFSDTDFKGAALDGVRFEKCRFRSCGLEGVRTSGARFLQCEFGDVSLAGAVLSETVFSYCRFRASSLAGVLVRDCRGRSVLFEECDLRSAYFQGGSLEGTDLARSDLRYSVFAATAFRDCLVSDCGVRSMAAMRVRGGPAPILAAAEYSEMFWALLLAGKGPARLPSVLAGEGRGFVSRCLDRWHAEGDLRRRERRMLAWNEGRMDLALARFGPEHAEFFTLLPYLLHTDIFDQEAGLGQAPHCEVEGYVPDHGALTLVREAFPGRRPGPKSGAVVTIKALYTIGSLGTMAQTPTSDVDYWVCYESEGLTGEDVKGLHRKLEALTVWAENRYGLEAYFFPMTMEAVRANDFGLSDAESSGTAQALLLKEEFYRTAVRVAGQGLLWWVTPPGASREDHDRLVRLAETHPLSGPPRLADLGRLADAPTREFFGASLWQLVKGIKSPYKSVMKLGLLDRYSRAGDRGPDYLCDRIKADVLAGRGGVERQDPYAALFAALSGHYREQGDPEAVELIKDSFRTKAGLQGIDFSFGFPGGGADREFLDLVFEEPKAEAAESAAKPSFEEMVSMGERVSGFMLSTYRRITESLAVDEGPGLGMDPQDLARLGRRILSAFAAKKHKVERNPFLDLDETEATELYFGAVKAHGKAPDWTVKGKRVSEKLARDRMGLLRRDRDPAMLLAWIFANVLYSPGSLVDAERTIAPLVLEDITTILQTLWEFFPHKRTFFPPDKDILDRERIRRVLFIPNLTVRRDQKKISRLSIIYDTSWGEFYCLTVKDPGPEFEKRASAFLEKTVPHDAKRLEDLRYLPPKRSMCLRVPMV